MINFCVIVRWADYFCDYEGFGSGRSRLIKLMKEPDYQKVMGNRPIVCMYQPQHLWEEKVGGIGKARAIFDSFRKESIDAKCGNPYLVVMDGNLENGKIFMDIIGADAISNYAVGGSGQNAPYSELTELAHNRWIKCKELQIPLITFATTGYNAKPRMDMKDPIGWLTSRNNLYGGRYYMLPTPDELAAHIRDAIVWTKENKNFCPAQTIIIYSWNEHDEGGWLCPTIDENNQVDNSRLNALKKVLESIQ